MTDQGAYQADWKKQSAKWSLLNWIGIFGSAITIFSNLEGFLKVAGWIRYLLVQWREINHWIVQQILSVFDLKIDPQTSASLSFAFFIVLLAIGAYRSDPDRQPSFFREFLLRLMPIVAFLGLAYLSGYTGYGQDLLINYGSAGGLVVLAPIALSALRFPTDGVFRTISRTMTVILIFILFWVIHVTGSIDPSLLSKSLLESDPDLQERLSSEFWSKFALDDLPLAEKLLRIGAFVLMVSGPFLITNIKPMLRRLIGVLIAVMVLVLISEIAKLDLAHYLNAPKV